ncbi:hypothetical protein P3L10_027806 [Capsicum annuum]
MHKVVRKLKLLKRELKRLYSQEFPNIVSETNADREALKLAQELLQTNPIDIEYQQKKRLAYQKYRKSSYLAEVFLQQRSKATWIRLGDDNTRYFFSMIKHKKLKQATTQLKDETEQWQSNPTIIAKLFVNYYVNLLGNDVKKAMFQIDSNKSLGPNGYGSGFYKAAWSIVGQDVISAVLEFF